LIYFTNLEDYKIFKNLLYIVRFDRLFSKVCAYNGRTYLSRELGIVYFSEPFCYIQSFIFSSLEKIHLSPFSKYLIINSIYKIYINCLFQYLSSNNVLIIIIGNNNLIIKSLYKNNYFFIFGF
jgi:hypothetical protein